MLGRPSQSDQPSPGAAARTLKSVAEAQRKYKIQNATTGAATGLFGDSTTLAQSGLFRGDHVVVAVSTTDPTKRWYATMTSTPGDRRIYFVINHEGAVYFSKQGPLTPDPDTCAIPAGVLPMSRAEDLDR